MNDMNELNEIKYQFIIDITKFFLTKYRDKELRDLNMVVRNVKILAPFIQEMVYVYDETIWFPDKPETYKNLIEFKVQLCNDLTCHLPFRLYIDKGMNQEPQLLINGSMY